MSMMITCPVVCSRADARHVCTVRIFLSHGTYLIILTMLYMCIPHAQVSDRTGKVAKLLGKIELPLHSLPGIDPVYVWLQVPCVDVKQRGKHSHESKVRYLYMSPSL